MFSTSGRNVKVNLRLQYHGLLSFSHRFILCPQAYKNVFFDSGMVFVELRACVSPFVIIYDLTFHHNI